jgi:nitrous oxide reductase accessory protein NosL
MKTNAFMLIAALALVGGCRASADGPPAIELDRTACSQCGMLVSDLRFAAAYREQGGEARIFDDIGCLRKAVRAGSKSRPTTFWFHDAVHGGWIDGRSSVFVESPAIHTPMGGGYLAFQDVAAAGREASARQGRIVRSLDELLGGPEKEDRQ